MIGGKKTSKEFNKLKKIFKNIPEKKQKVAEKLIQNAAFMAEQLDALQQDIQEKGYVSEYQNGENQWGKKKAPEVEIYIALTKNYTGIITKLLDLVDEVNDEEDELAKFRKERGLR